jgi:uncharacterized protein YecA (UPF0149 family)
MVAAVSEQSMNPEPLELSDPVLAEHFRQIASRSHPLVRGLEINTATITLRLQSGYRIRKFRQMPGRNDPCSCGSGKKFKKCCGR